LLVSCVVGASIGLVFYFIQKPKYQAVCTFILEEKQGGLGGLGNIASQFGIEFGGMAGSSMFAGDNIIDILQSNTILEKTLLSKVDTSTGGTSGTLADMYLDFSGLRQIEELKNISFRNATVSLQQDSVMHLIQDNVVKKMLHIERLNRKGSIISVSVTSPNQSFSKQMAEQLVIEARNMYINIKSGTAQNNVRRLEEKADSILRQLNTKTYQTANLFQMDANPALRSLSVPSEITSRDKSVLSAIYLEVVKNLEISKTLLSQQTPVIQMLDVPELPLKNKTKSIMLLVFTFSVLGGGIYCGYALLKFSRKFTA
jgi:uncharacterized protein involved in exopolysaccharide biosynthesis